VTSNFVPIGWSLRPVPRALKRSSTGLRLPVIVSDRTPVSGVAHDGSAVVVGAVKVPVAIVHWPKWNRFGVVG
jgi:hypothetical protein